MVGAEVNGGDPRRVAAGEARPPPARRHDRPNAHTLSWATITRRGIIRHYSRTACRFGAGRRPRMRRRRPHDRRVLRKSGVQSAAKPDNSRSHAAPPLSGRVFATPSGLQPLSPRLRPYPSQLILHGLMKRETALFADSNAITMAMATTALAIRRARRVDNLTTTPRVRHFRRHHASQPFSALSLSKPERSSQDLAKTTLPAPMRNAAQSRFVAAPADWPRTARSPFGAKIAASPWRQARRATGEE